VAEIGSFVAGKVVLMKKTRFEESRFLFDEMYQSMLLSRWASYGRNGAGMERLLISGPSAAARVSSSIDASQSHLIFNFTSSSLQADIHSCLKTHTKIIFDLPAISKTMETLLPAPVPALGKTTTHATTTEVDLGSSPTSSSPQLDPTTSIPSSPLPSQSSIAHFLGQAPEVLHNIFQHVDPTDLAALAQSCRHFNNLIKNDELLWKLQYLALFVSKVPAQMFDRQALTSSSRTGLSSDRRDNSLVAIKTRQARLLAEAARVLRRRFESMSYRRSMPRFEPVTNSNIKAKELEGILTYTTHLAKQITSNSSKNIDFLSNLYRRGININQVLCQSSLFANARYQRWPGARTRTLRQLSAQLHVLAGMNVDSPWPEPDATSLCLRNTDRRSTDDPDDDDTDDNDWEPAAESPESEDTSEDVRLQRLHNPRPVFDIHAWARSRVYDLRRYRTSNLWGPFTDDHTLRIDWEKLQAIMVIIAFNTKLYTRQRGVHWSNSIRRTPIPPEILAAIEERNKGLLPAWQNLFSDIAPNTYVSKPLSGKLKAPPHPELDVLDPYGVTGTWSRIVCFLDYNELHRFNFEREDDLPMDEDREPLFADEAFRLIKLHLHVTRIEEQEGLDDAGEPLLPIVYFEGRSRSTYMAWDPNANSRIRGKQQKSLDGAH
jgi:hypothetical protein